MSDAEIAVILRRLDDQDKQLGRIERKVGGVSDRVSELETERAVQSALARDHMRGIDARKAWTIGVISAAVTGTAGSIVLILLGGHA